MGGVGSTACALQKPEIGDACCCEDKHTGDDVPEYEPVGKQEAQAEFMEQAPQVSLSAVAAQGPQCKRKGCEVLRVGPALRRKDGYFARELQELQALPRAQILHGKHPAYTFKTGAIYFGEWRGSARHGMGQQTWPDGAKFVGIWDANAAGGLGQFTHADGDVFVGQWKNNVARGFGTYYHKNGLASYSGHWVDDLQDGDGIEEWDNGSKYIGQFVHGRKEGNGIYRWPDGSTYSGQWRANSINGHGQYVSKDCREFKGMWREAIIDGSGQFSWADGRIFRGQYTENQKQGFGVFTWRDGSRFEGFWHSGKRHGHGATYSSRGDVLKNGVWKHGQPIAT